MVTDSGGGGENPWLPQGRKLCTLIQGCLVASFDAVRRISAGYIPGAPQAAVLPTPTATFPLRQKCVMNSMTSTPGRFPFFHLLTRRLRVNDRL
jgi:hypothetical protein